MLPYLPHILTTVYSDLILHANVNGEIHSGLCLIYRAGVASAAISLSVLLIRRFFASRDEFSLVMEGRASARPNGRS